MKKFGTFESSEELNKAAEGLLQEGDLKSLKELAKENGIPGGMVTGFIEGKGPFSDPVTAAIGKLETELAEFDETAKGYMSRLVEYLTSKCEKEKFAEEVMKKDRTLKNFEKMWLKEAKSRVKVRKGQQVVCMTEPEVFQEARRFFGKGRYPWKKQK
ncbi:MAG: hypothetical protein Q4B70_00920 [Lachnospiraceae bacterium]|nr:hypothetical protein [Lachnospiraceae bacterium]